MAALFHKAFSFTRSIAVLLMILIIGIKTTTVIKAVSVIKKEIALLDKADTNEEEKSETDCKSEQEAETATLIQAINQLILPYITVKHQTAYYIHYSLSFNNRITIPPPDFC